MGNSFGEIPFIFLWTDFLILPLNCGEVPCFGRFLIQSEKANLLSRIHRIASAFWKVWEDVLLELYLFVVRHMYFQDHETSTLSEFESENPARSPATLRTSASVQNT